MRGVHGRVRTRLTASFRAVRRRCDARRPQLLLKRLPARGLPAPPARTRTNHLMNIDRMPPASVPVRLLVDEALIEPIAARVAEIAVDQLLDERRLASPWLTGAAAAADYLGWPVERVYKRIRSLPHYRDGNLLMFRREELDAFIELGYEGPRRPVDFGASRRSRADTGAPVRFQVDGR